jgi:magnesium chelatase subunit D
MNCRANIPLCISEGETYDPILIPSISGKPTKQFLNNEVLSCAKQLSKLDCDTIVIDTEDKFVSTGIASEIARVSLAKYYRIDIRDALSKVTAVAHNS